MALSGMVQTTFYNPSGGARFAYRIYWSASQNIANNTSTVTFTAKLAGLLSTSSIVSGHSNSVSTITVDGTSYTGKNNISISGITEKTLYTTTRTLTHNADGTRTFTLGGSQQIEITFPKGYIGTVTIPASTQTLNTIARATTPSLSNSKPKMGSTITISTPRASSSFTHKVYFYFGGVAQLIASGVTTSTTWTLPVDLALEIPNSLTGTGTIMCETYSGTTEIGSRSVSFTATVSDATVPSISNVVLAEAASVGLTEWVQNKSRIKVTTTASGSQGSTIKKYAVTFPSLGTYEGKTVTSPVVTASSSSYVVSVTVTDSRGRTASTTRSIVIRAWNAPQVTSFSVVRATSGGVTSDTGLHPKISLAWSISSVNSKNTRSVTVRIRPASGGTWTTIYTNTASYSGSASKTVTSFEMNADISYEVEAVVADYYTSTSRTQEVSSTFSLFNWNKSGRGFAIGKASEADTFEVAIPSTFYDTVQLSSGVIPIRITTGQDLDSLTACGWYDCPANVTVATLVNCPTQNAFSLFVEKHAGFKQTVTEYMTGNSTRMWFRNYYSNTWGEWIEVFTNASARVLESTTGGTARCVRYPNGWQTLTWRRTLTTTITNPSGGMFYSNNNLAQANWPWPFAEVPAVSITVGGQGQLIWSGCPAMPSATQSPSVFLYKGSSDSSSRTYDIHLIAEGRWK